MPRSNGAWVFTNRTWPKDTAVRSVFLSRLSSELTSLRPARSMSVTASRTDPSTRSTLLRLWACPSFPMVGPSSLASFFSDESAD